MVLFKKLSNFYKCMVNIIKNKIFYYTIYLEILDYKSFYLNIKFHHFFHICVSGASQTISNHSIYLRL